MDSLLMEIGNSLPKDEEHSLLKFLYTVDRLNVDVNELKKILKSGKVDVNKQHQENSAILIALNRFLGSNVTAALIAAGAVTNYKNREGILVSELLFRQDAVEIDQVKEANKCYKRANTGIKFSEASQQWADSKELRKLLNTQTQSSIIVPKSSGHAPAPVQRK